MSVAPKLPKEVLSLPETTHPCPSCGVRPRRPVRFCTHCGTPISGSRPARRSEVPAFTPSFTLSEPGNPNAIRNGFLVFCLALPLCGALFFLNGPKSAAPAQPLKSESALSAPLVEEISTSAPSGRPVRKTASGRNRAETPDLTAADDTASGGLPVPTIPDAPQPVLPYRTVPVASQTPISVPAKSRPVPTPPLPGPEFKNEKGTGFEPRP